MSAGAPTSVQYFSPVHKFSLMMKMLTPVGHSGPAMNVFLFCLQKCVSYFNPCWRLGFSLRSGVCFSCKRNLSTTENQEFFFPNKSSAQVMQAVSLENRKERIKRINWNCDTRKRLDEVLACCVILLSSITMFARLVSKHFMYSDHPKNCVWRRFDLRSQDQKIVPKGGFVG